MTLPTVVTTGLVDLARRISPALLLGLILLPAPAATAQQAAEPARPAGPSSGEKTEEVIKLSPFEVVSESRGYFQSNAMSGTRLNSKIEDLGQSITVMTKAQMQDFAMLDINDVFDYMAGTEGTHTYSDIVVDRTGAVTDNIALDPNNANRVSGLSNANIALDNIQTTGRVPIDPLWIDSIELSRGPNANIFGLGNAGGTVNQVPATANLTREFTRVEGRGDSDGGWRTSLDVNRILLKNRLAVRASYAYQHTGFVRKPSYENARRVSFQAKARPFENTTLSLSWFGYRNVSQRPNFTTPRDNITGWIAAGKPAWDPVSRLITINGVSYGQNSASGNQLVAGSTIPITNALPSYFNNSPSDGRSFFRTGNEDDAPYWSTPTVTNATDPRTGVSNNIRFVATSPVNSYGAAQPLFATYAALSDKSIYDWEHVSLMSANQQWDNDNMYLAQLDQVFFNTPRQTLAAQLTYMREDARQLQNLPLGPASVNGVIGELYADPNTRNLDGSPNPYFGRPYLRSKEPFLRDQPWLWDTGRVQLAYRLDFSRDAGWSKWLGSHQLLGYYEYKDRQNRAYAWRRTATSYSQPYFQAEFARNAPLANRTTGGNSYAASNNITRVYEFYYVGDTPGGGVEYGPRFFPNGSTVPFVWGNTGAFHYDPVTIGWTPSPDGSGGGASKETVVKTLGASLQSFFLDGKLVTTFGLRKDKVYDHSAPFAVLTPDFLNFDYVDSNRWSPGWGPAEGTTKSASVVLRPFRDFCFVRNQMDHGSEVGRFLAEAVGSLGLTYNWANSFVPQGPAVDLYLRPLPNQTGTTRDIGFWMTLFDDRLSIRYNHSKRDSVNLRNGDISTIAQRVLRADGLNATDRWNLQDRATDWVTQLNPTWSTDQIKAEVAKTMGLTQAQIDGLEGAITAGRLAAIQDYVANEDELELNFNPTREWTVSGSVTKLEAINKNAGSTIEDWITQRMPTWESVEDPRFTAASPGASGIPVGSTGHLLWRYIKGSSFTAYGYDANNSAATNFVTFVEGPLAVYRQLEGRPRPQVSKYTFKLSTRYQLSGLTDNRILKNMSVGGSVRWIDRKAIGFLGVQSLPDKITELDTNKPVYTPAVAQVDLFVSYSTKLFHDKVRARFQLNAKNIGEPGGGLLVTQVFPDGTPLAYRIRDPRQFILSASFEL
jgi:hypothetical protein